MQKAYLSDLVRPDTGGRGASLSSPDERAQTDRHGDGHPGPGAERPFELFPWLSRWKHQIEIWAGILTVLTALAGVLQYFGAFEWLWASFSSLPASPLRILAIVLVVLLAAVSLGSFVFWRRFQHAKLLKSDAELLGEQKVRQARSEAAEQAAAREVELREAFAERVSKLSAGSGEIEKFGQTIVQLENQIERHKTINKHFRELARLHAECDRHIFDSLFQFMTNNATPEQACRTTAEWIYANMEATLDCLCRIISEFTGERTAACIKYITALPVEGPEKATYITMCRDTYSKFETSRGEEDRLPVRVADNTITHEIIGKNRLSWGDDNLTPLHERGHYKNKRELWWDKYNATFGVGICTLGFESDSCRYWAALCIDNLHGGIANKQCESILLETSWRFAALIHRLRYMSPYIAVGKKVP